jgi:hypothetical protein
MGNIPGFVSDLVSCFSGCFSRVVYLRFGFVFQIAHGPAPFFLLSGSVCPLQEVPRGVIDGVGRFVQSLSMLLRALALKVADQKPDND